MLLIHGLAKGNARGAERLYCEKYPQRDELISRMFFNLHHNLGEYGSLRGNRHNKGVSRVNRTPSMEQNLLDAVQNRTSRHCCRRRNSEECSSFFCNVNTYPHTIFKEYCHSICNTFEQ
ncbi:hypothetical protein TNCV_1241471 [Trichonephila clavipes]|uniref:DUF4817 domain-containing protein n=1 Tax=Trichonephila clavipes TaxID=2585209 RepID=A0A8X6WEV3_TRICX|nr:hypothetical protein TNCV_1241471 [Trichonephila clavipes]